MTVPTLRWTCLVLLALAPPASDSLAQRPEPERSRPASTAERAAQAEARAAELKARAADTSGDAARREFERAVEAQLAAEKAAPEDSEDSREMLRRAAAGYGRVLELRPDAVAARYNLGRAQLALGDVRGAARSFELAAASPGPRRVFYLEKWADFLSDQGQWDRATRAYEEVVLLEPRLDGPHDLLRERYLALRDQDPQRLLDYLWRLVDGRQASRAADLALAALEADWPKAQRPELLAAVAASLAQVHATPGEILASDLLRRLRPFAEEPGIGEGVRELVQLYASPGQYPDSFPWWRRSSDSWDRRRGVSRSDALRAALRALGDSYRERRSPEIATSCYRAAVELDSEPDALAMRSLASAYVEQSDLEALDRLAIQYTGLRGPLFRAKGDAYAVGDVEKILEYHRVLGQIFGSLAASGKRGWGSTGDPTTALFQLARAYDVARQVDEEARRSGDERTTRIDPDLTLLYAQGLAATGDAERADDVRLEAARRLTSAGDAPAAEKVLRGVTRESLSPDQRIRLQRLERIEPVREPEPPSREAD